MKPDKTKVVFRFWENSVIALFPEIPADNWGVYCESYQHIGQHGGADYHGIIQKSRRCSYAEATPLWNELTDKGYNLEIIQRTMPSIHEARKTSARGI